MTFRFSQIITTVSVVRKSSPKRTADDDCAGGYNGDHGGGGCGDRLAVDPATHAHNERIFRRLMPNYHAKEPMPCELCGDTFSVPVSYHMLTTHPGCGYSSGGRGYTSNGTYKTGWSGACGEGGIAWYLLCEPCRKGYLKRVKPPKPPPLQSSAAAVTASGAVRSRKTAAVIRRVVRAAIAPDDDDVDDSDLDDDENYADGDDDRHRHKHVHG